MLIIDGKSGYKFNNNVDYCIGTGRIGLSLGKEYQAQLKLVQDKIGFKHIRGHGLLSDDMSIYQEYKISDNEVGVEYNYTYLDLVMDSYLEVGIEPFIELGFMPSKLASGNQTVFYWKGNVTPPKDYSKWCDLVRAILTHLMDRYGSDRVVTWPVEVWNEPNLTVFWKDADMKEYFKLFETTFKAVKELDSRFTVGGPAVCGGTDEVWISAFMDFCEEKDLAIDFVTRHHYTTELPKHVGHYGYPALSEAELGFANLHTTRDIIDSHDRYKGLPIHITEFNTSYIPNAPVHDTTRNAAYIAQQLSRLGDDNESYSYWTFGDIFEEQGVPYTPFHGGFGLVANGCIPKPTFWTFAFFKYIKGGSCVYKDDNSVIVKMPDGTFRGISWNYSLTDTVPSMKFEFALPTGEGESCLITKIVDEDNANPLKIWHDMGEPSSLTEAQKQILIDCANPGIQSASIMASGGLTEISYELRSDAVIYWECNSVKRANDRGYDYSRVMAGEPSEEN